MSLSTSDEGKGVDGDPRASCEVLEGIQRSGVTSRCWKRGVTPSEDERVWGGETVDWEALGFTPKEAAWSILKAEMIGKARLSKSTRRALARILKPNSRSKGEYHYKTRRKRRRDKYPGTDQQARVLRWYRFANARETRWNYHRSRVRDRGHSWEISPEEFLEVMDTVTSSGIPIWQRIYDLRRADVTNKSYTLSNIVLVDRYTKEQLYPK